MIKKRDLDLCNIDALQRCFVVRPPTADALKYLARAKKCLGIQFDYDASPENCETFFQHAHGVWDKSFFQSPTGGGQEVINAFTKLIKSPLDEVFASLSYRMRNSEE